MQKYQPLFVGGHEKVARADIKASREMLVKQIHNFTTDPDSGQLLKFVCISSHF